MNITSSLAPTLTTNLNSIQSSIVDTQNQLATGKKNLNAAQVGIVTRLSAQVNGYNSVVSNIATGTSLLNVSNTALTSIASIVSQCKDIATQAANAGLTTGDRTALNTTFQQLLSQVTSLITNATVNGDNILSTGAAVNVQTGITGSSTTTIANQNMSLILLIPAGGYTSVPAVTDAFGGVVAGKANVLSSHDAALAIDALTTALGTISTNQSTLSATQVGLTAQSSASASLATNLQATVDSMQAVDSTALQAKLQSLNNQQSIDYYLISQMNTAAQASLSIFR